MINANAFEELLRELEKDAEKNWNIGRDNAQLLAILIKTLRARRILEVGTSNGYSTLWLARALLETNADNAKVITLESDAGRAAMAREIFRRAGVENIISLQEGDARTRIGELSAPFDFVFLDAEKSEYADYLRSVLPLVRTGGLIVGDDTLSLRAQMTEYVDLAFSHPELESVEVPIDDGIIISRKKG